MQKLVWQNANGVELDLTSGNYGITEWEGFSNASLNIQQQQVPFQDGGVFLDALIEQRELSITLAMQDNNNLELRYQLRRELISALNPKLGEGYLIYTNDFISKRIKCVPQIPLFETHNSDTVGTPKASLSWTACEPYWEDLEETEATVSIFEDVDIVNTGDISSSIEIDIQPEVLPLENIRIINKTTSQMIEVNGQINESIKINTGTGNKTVTGIDIETDYISNGKIEQIINVDDVLYGIQSNVVVKSYDGINWEAVYNTPNKITRFKYIPAKRMWIIALYLNASYGAYRVRYTDDLKDWKELSFYDGTTISILDMDYSPSLNLWVFVGTRRIIRTTDLQTFTADTVGSTYNCCMWDSANNKFIIAGQTNTNVATVSTSANGSSWTTQTTPVTDSDSSFLSICKWNNKIYLLSNVGKLIESTNGTSWTTNNSELTDVNSLANISSRLLMFGENGIVMSSQDGSNWSYHTTGVEYPLNAFCVFNGYNVFWNNAYEFVMTKNFSTWENKTIPSTTFEENINGIAVTEDESVCVFSSGKKLYRTTNFKTFAMVLENDHIGGKIKYLNGKFYEYYFGAYIFVSSDGLEWQEIDLSANTSYVNDITYSKKLNQFVIATGSDGILYGDFTNGFQNGNIDDDAGGNKYCAEWIDYLQKYFVGGAYRSVYMSEDGINWVRHLTTTTSYVSLNPRFFFVYENKQIYAGCGTDGFIASSDGGETWNYIRDSNSAVMTPIVAMDSDEDGDIFAMRGGTVIFYYTSWDGGEHSFIIREKEFGTTQVYCIKYIKRLQAFLVGGADGLLAVMALTAGTNYISNLSVQSDMTMKLEQGSNVISMALFQGQATATIKFRQKYIGV